LTSIITTHHHWDHAGGNREMVHHGKNYMTNGQLAKFPGLTVHGGKDCAMTNHYVKDREQFQIGEIEVTGPGTVNTGWLTDRSAHTLSHTRFCVLFRSTWRFPGRVHRRYAFQRWLRPVLRGPWPLSAQRSKFQGVAEEMHNSLNIVLGSLPPDTKIYALACFVQG
jgi:hydroxyacylglutathione hydrolase